MNMSLQDKIYLMVILTGCQADLNQELILITSSYRDY